MSTVPPRDLEPQEAEPPPAVASTRRIILGVLLVVALAIGLTLLIAKAAGYREVLDHLAHAESGWLAMCLVLEVVACVGYVVAIRGVVAMDDGPRLGAWHATRLWLASVGATRIISPAGAGGIAITYWALRRRGLEARAAASRVFGLNMMLWGMFGALAFVAAILVLLRVGQEAPVALTVPWVVIAPIVVVISFWITAPGRGERLATREGSGWLRTTLAAAVAGLLEVRQMLFRPLEHLEPITGGVMYWLGDIASLWAALRAVGADVPFHAVALAYVTAYIALLLPLPTGGFGAIDAAAALILTLLGIPLAEAFGGVVVWRVFNFWIPTIPALVELARVRDLGRRLAAEGAATGGPPDGMARPAA